MNRLKKLFWIEDHLHTEVVAQPMHDGVGYFWREKLVLIVIENSQTDTHRGVRYPFQIWNGCFFPVVKLKQNAAIKKFLFLENHPAMANCLYLPAEDENFQEQVIEVLQEIFKGNPLFGEFVKVKKPTQKDKAQFEKNVKANKPTLFLSHDNEVKVSKPRAPRRRINKKKKTGKKLENNFILSKITRLT